MVRTIGPAGAFEVTPPLKQAAVIIDRVTYLASCELLRPPEQVSLKRLTTSISIGGGGNLEEDRRCVVGAILERQVDSLAGSLWKPDVQSVVAGLLSDCVSVYDPENRPIRRVGVMIRVLELTYYTGVAQEDIQLAKSAEEIEALLSLEVHLFSPIVRISSLLALLQNVGRDSALTHLLALHKAEMHMWLALHAHRQVHPQQYTLITQHAQEACRILKRWIPGTPVETAKPKESPKQVRAARKAKGKTASTRAVAAATRKPKASKVVPVTPKRPHGKYATRNSFRCHQLRLSQGPTRLRRLSRRPLLEPRKMSYPYGELVGSYHS